MLTTPDNLFLHLLDDDLQDELLHQLSQDGGTADRPAVPWDLLLVLFEGWSDTGFSLVLRLLSCPPGPFKGGEERLSNDIRQLPQYSWVHSIRTHGFVGVQIALVISQNDLSFCSTRMFERSEFIAARL